MAQATFYDGLHAERYTAEVVPAGARSIRVTPSVGDPVEIDADELIVADEDQQQLLLSRRGMPGWRLILEQPVDADLRAALPGTNRYGGWIDRIGLGKASLILAGIAGVVVLIGHTAPLWIAPLVPPSWERNVGNAIVGDFGDLRCRSPQGQAALEALVERLDPGGTAAGSTQIRIAALDVDMFNAAAVPGSNIIIFKGALNETKDVDALAGIVAHEIAHVRRRHVTEALVRELGIGALIRTFAGTVGANAEQVVGLSFTRANEREADADAIATLRRAGIDPRPTATLFAKLSKESGGDTSPALQFLDSHPGSKGRAANFASSYDPKVTYRPALDPAAAKAMLTACGVDPKKPKAGGKQAE